MPDRGMGEVDEFVFKPLASLSQILGMFHVYASVCKLKWHVTVAAVRGAHLSAARTVSWHLANLAQGQARWSLQVGRTIYGS